MYISICLVYLFNNYKRNYITYFCFIVDPCILYHLTIDKCESLIPIYTLLIITGIDKSFENYKNIIK